MIIILKKIYSYNGFQIFFFKLENNSDEKNNKRKYILNIIS